MRARMSKAEEAAFRAFAAQAGSYFEYGIGGSTYAAAELVKGPLVAIDSDPAWVEKAREAIASSGHARSLIHVDIGPTQQWGYPVGGLGSDQHRRYYEAIVEHEPERFDLCLVDGRFRVACLASALRHTRPDTVVAIHDYRIRKQYHAAEEFGRIIFEAEDISFFVRRSGVTLATLDQATARFGKDPQ